MIFQQREFFWSRTGITALVIFVFFFKLGTHRTLTFHEALVAVPAREMLVMGNMQAA